MISKTYLERIFVLEERISELQSSLAHMQELAQNPLDFPKGWMIIRVDEFDTAGSKFNDYIPEEDAFYVVPSCLGLPSFEEAGLYASMSSQGVTLTEDRSWRERPIVHQEWALTPREALEIFLRDRAQFGDGIVTFSTDVGDVSYLEREV